jgi:hypothetical protein
LTDPSITPVVKAFPPSITAPTEAQDGKNKTNPDTTRAVNSLFILFSWFTVMPYYITVTVLFIISMNIILLI